MNFYLLFILYQFDASKVYFVTPGNKSIVIDGYDC